MTSRPTVLIVGGGASGALVAANLLRRSQDIQVVVIEPRAKIGRGMAYSTDCPLHLLNVPAAKMSAFPHDPSHFLRWLHSRELSYGKNCFVPRMIYGDYLEAVLAAAREDTDAGRFRHVRSEAIGIVVDEHGLRLRLKDCSMVSGDSLVLALGNAAPAPWPNLSPEVAGSGRFFGLTWDPLALRPSDVQEPVLLLGTGLTAIDAVLALRHNGHRGPIQMVSRRGLLPQRHLLSKCAPLPCTAASSARELLRNLRLAAADAEILHDNWRVAVDGARPQTNALWQGLSLPEQSRLLRHARPYWDVHRHRMAPEIAASLQEEMERGTVRVVAGRTGPITLTAGGLQVELRRRSNRTAETIHASRIINCTGPESNLKRLPNPLVQDMIKQGLLMPHPLRTGALVDNDGALLGAAGHPSRCLFAMGPLRTGTLLETVAMPEIRQQAAELAQFLIDDSIEPGLPDAGAPQEIEVIGR
jgi:uncharacterized NAD(P)/FAD-binding protein YdhS